VLWMNQEQRDFLEIPPDVTIESLNTTQFYIDPSDRTRILKHIEENGFTKPIIFAIKTFTGKICAVKALGRFINAIYPSYFKTLDSYRRIIIPNW